MNAFQIAPMTAEELKTQLTDEKYNALTEDAAGIGDLLSEFVENDQLEELEKELFNLWRRFGIKGTPEEKKNALWRAADEFCHFMDVKAVEFACKWADAEAKRMQDQDEGPEPQEPYNRYKDLERRGVTGYAN